MNKTLSYVKIFVNEGISKKKKSCRSYFEKNSLNIYSQKENFQRTQIFIRPDMNIQP